jgi:hypothetical protein
MVNVAVAATRVPNADASATTAAKQAANAAVAGTGVGSAALCPQTTVRDYNKFLVRTLESSDSERQELLKQFQNLSTALEPLGDIRRELDVRTSELHDAQRIATEQALALQEEREKVARLMAENNTLMAEQDDARAKIGALLQMRLTEAKMFPNTAECPIMVQIPSAGSSHLQENKGGKKVSGSSSSGAGCALGSHSAEVNRNPTLSLRSVVDSVPRGYIPPRSGAVPHNHSSMATTAAANDNSSGARTEAAPVDFTQVLYGSNNPGSALVATLSAEVKTLKQLLDEQRAAYERDRARRIADTRRAEQDLHRELRKHSAAVDELNKRLHEAVSDLCVFRHQSQITERTLRGEVEILTARAAEAERLLTVERSRRVADVQSALDAQDAKTGHVVEHVRLRLSEREEQLRLARERHERDLESVRAGLKKAADDAEREKRIRIRCEQRLQAAEEGRQSDVGLLRQQLRALEKRIFFNTVHSEHMREVLDENDAAASEDLQRDAGCFRHHHPHPTDADAQGQQRRGRSSSGSPQQRTAEAAGNEGAEDDAAAAAKRRAVRILADLMATQAFRRQDHQQPSVASPGAAARR